MLNQNFNLILAEPSSSYKTNLPEKLWVQVLVDCPGIEGLFTYSKPEELIIKIGDIVSVPFGTQIVGGIVIKFTNQLPDDLEIDRIRTIEEVIISNFFPNSYWQLINQTADYYTTDLMNVIRVALPPGLLARSQRRIRLKLEALPEGAETFCSINARTILELLKKQKDGNYSSQYLQRQVKGAYRAIQELAKKGWIESYLEPPKSAHPKLQKAVTLLINNFPQELTEKQRKVLEILRQQGGEMWLNELTKIANTSTPTIENLEKKGYLVIEIRERLRLLQETQPEKDQTKKLNQAQTNALEIINNLEGFAEILLHGVTGSGKTEVYLQAIEPVLAQGKSALVLVPEIGLTPQLTDRFRARFGNQICVYHSALSDGERYDTWRQMLTGDTQVVIGTRSAIFAPLPKLGIIILDEEHDSSFKQQQSAPNYHAKTVGKWRAQLDNCPLILGSATPSLESWLTIKEQKNNLNGSYYLSLPERVNSRPLPPVKIVDMREELKNGNRSIFSLSLQSALEQLLDKKQQGILFISRRGHSTFVSCRSCGYVIECPHCDVSLSYHYTHTGGTELLRCHYCNFSRLHPNQCPECSSPYLKFFGTGTQKVDQELAEKFPQLRTIRFDSDTTRRKGAHRELIERFSQGEADLLIGTQMLTKGLDLAQVTLVGVVSADGLLYHSDYRASERAFQTLTQVAGRAGRGDDSGQVIIQTYSSEHPVIQAVKNHDYLAFTARELPQREMLNYPPYGHLILLKLSGLNELEVQQNAVILADACGELLGEKVEILGPAPANVMRVARRYRWQILLKFSEDIDELKSLSNLRHLCSPSVSISIDVDPMNID